jgi:hypothetical protein
MKNKNFISLVFFVVFTLLLAGCNDPSYSGQRGSPQADRWVFDPLVANKIQKNLARGEAAVGLSKLEQRMLENYGIGFGKTFMTSVRGTLWQVTRTSTGLRFEKSAVPLAGVNLPSFPLIHIPNHIAPVSFQRHERENKLPYQAWVFDQALQKKIQKRIFLKGIPSEIGLNIVQQKILKRYGVRVGQSFRTSVAGRVLTVKRVSLGLQIQGMAKEKKASYLTS